MWHRRSWAAPSIRVAGIVLLGLSAAAIRLPLVHARTSPAGQALDYLLALLAFVCTSAGSAMLWLGAHLFDEVEISERWRRVDPKRGSRFPDGSGGEPT